MKGNIFPILSPLKYVVGEILLSSSPQEISGGRHWSRRYNKLEFHNFNAFCQIL